MARNFNFEFLQIEFKNIYEDINGLFNTDNQEDINEFAKRLIKDLIKSIYSYNNLYYDEKLHYSLSVDALDKLKIIPKDMIQKIVILAEGITDIYKYENNTYLYNKTKENLYQICAWLVINCGTENYSLITDKLGLREKRIFQKYLPNEEEKKAIMCYNCEITEEEKEEKGIEYLELGEKYYLGRGVKKNYREAYKYFRFSARCGNEYGQAYLGVFYDKGISIKRDYFAAAKWYHKSACKGNSFAQYSLGMLYLQGNGVDKEADRAIIWFEKSAENDYVPAYYQLGRAYYDGIGVSQNYEMAFKWYLKAATKDFAAAQYAISFMYKNGDGCEVNTVKAYYWIEKAAENDYDDAFYIVGQSYLEGVYFEQNYEKAYEYLNKGYLALDSDCIEALANMYMDGLYVEKDILKAIDLLNKGIDIGEISFYYKLGKIYEDQGLIKDAITIYEEGHILEELKCTQRLGVIYYNGEGVSRDLEKAIEYMEVAAEKKAPHAMYMLGIAYLRLNRFGKDTNEISKSLLREAFQLESPYAAEYLAYIIIDEAKEGTPIDSEELIGYIEFGIENNIKSSIFQYGYIYEKGIGVDKDNEKAYSYYNVAAQQGVIRAMLKLGDWFKIGKFVNRDISYAIKWYEEAAVLGDITAIENLIEIYERGIGDRKNELKAVYYVLKLIELDTIKGKLKLAEYCYNGVGIEKDINKGWEIIEEIRDIDKGIGNNIIGRFAEYGYIDMLPNEIIEVYKQGIELGNLECYGCLAEYLYNNKFYDTDEYKALFNIAMEGKELGVDKCNYVILKNKLDESMKEATIQVEEYNIIDQLKKLVKKGFYEAIKELMKWYEVRKPEDKMSYNRLIEDAEYFKIDI